MKQWIQIILLVPSIAFGKICKEVSPLMKEFRKQSQWQEITVQDKTSPVVIQGSLDLQNNFYPYKISGRHKVAAELELDNRKSHRDMFIRNCRDYSGAASRLRFSRETNFGTQFKARVQYLPSLEGFNNAPLEALETGSLQLQIEYGPNSLINRLARPDEVKQQIFQQLNTQLSTESVGVYELDLSNLDDFVCDLAHGQATLGVYRRMFSVDPLVQQEELVSERDLQRIDQSWRQRISVGTSLNHALLLAGAEGQKLASDGQIAPLSDASLLKVAQTLIIEAPRPMAEIKAEQWICLYDSLQEYSKGQIAHFLNITFGFDGMDVLFREEQK